MKTDKPLPPGWSRKRIKEPLGGEMINLVIPAFCDMPEAQEVIDRAARLFYEAAQNKKVTAFMNFTCEKQKETCLIRLFGYFGPREGFKVRPFGTLKIKDGRFYGFTKARAS